MNKKLICTLMAGALLVGTVTGCGSSSEGESSAKGTELELFSSKAENKDMFIEIVKEYITSTRRAYSNGIEFTSDYSRIRKMDVSGLPKLY